jgi:hypothetical protein
MNKRWLITEKVIAIFLILWGIFILAEDFYSIFNNYHYALRYLDANNEKISYLKFSLKYNLMLLDVIPIIGGILLMATKKIGWLLSFLSVVLNSFLYLIPSDKIQKDAFKHIQVILILVCISIFFLTLTIVLASKPFRNRYKPTSGTWFIILISVSFVVIDKLLLYYFF